MKEGLGGQTHGEKEEKVEEFLKMTC